MSLSMLIASVSENARHMPVRKKGVGLAKLQIMMQTNGMMNIGA